MFCKITSVNECSTESSVFILSIDVPGCVVSKRDIGGHWVSSEQCEHAFVAVLGIKVNNKLNAVNLSAIGFTRHESLD
jgi:hypothetical protein